MSVDCLRFLFKKTENGLVRLIYENNNETDKDKSVVYNIGRDIYEHPRCDNILEHGLPDGLSVEDKEMLRSYGCSFRHATYNRLSDFAHVEYLLMRESIKNAMYENFHRKTEYDQYENRYPYNDKEINSKLDDDIAYHMWNYELVEREEMAIKTLETALGINIYNLVIVYVYNN